MMPAIISPITCGWSKTLFHDPAGRAARGHDHGHLQEKATLNSAGVMASPWFPRRLLAVAFHPLERR
jgi:hypothetical protein